MRSYILDEDGNPVLETDFLKAAIWLEKHGRHIALTESRFTVISTVFLGVDLNHFRSGPPQLFETLVLGRSTPQLDIGKSTSYPVTEGDGLLGDFSLCHRYATRDEALEGHEKVVETVGQIEESNKSSFFARMRVPHLA